MKGLTDRWLQIKYAARYFLFHQRVLWPYHLIMTVHNKRAGLPFGAFWRCISKEKSVVFCSIIWLFFYFKKTRYSSRRPLCSSELVSHKRRDKRCFLARDRSEKLNSIVWFQYIFRLANVHNKRDVCNTFLGCSYNKCTNSRQEMSR